MLELANIMLMVLCVVLFLRIFYIFYDIHVAESSVFSGILIVVWFFRYQTIFIINDVPVIAFIYSALIFGVVGTIIMEIFAGLFMNYTPERAKKPSRKQYRRIH